MCPSRITRGPPSSVPHDARTASIASARTPWRRMMRAEISTMLESKAMGIAEELRSRIEGEVRFDRYTRILYSTDASIYQIEPIGVVVPRHAGDVEEVLRLAARERVPVLPGIVHHVLGAHLKPHRLRFGPETATSNRANLGGMIGNNSAGARSLIYGKTVDNVIEVRAILADGTEAVFGPVWRRDLASKTAGDSLEAKIYREALRLGEEYRPEIEKRYPRIPRRVSGYNLDELLDPDEVNLAKLSVGSEGTLATVVEAKLELVPLPAATGLAVLHFDGLLPALEAAFDALELGPSAVELVGEMVLDLARPSLGDSRRPPL